MDHRPGHVLLRIARGNRLVRTMHWACGPLVLRAAGNARTDACATCRHPDSAPNRRPCRSVSCAGRPAGRKSQIVALLTLLRDCGAFSKLERTDSLDGPTRQPKVSGRPEHVAVARPHVAFTGLDGRRKVYGVRCAQDAIARPRQDQRAGPSQQGFVDRNQFPQPVRYVVGKARGQIACITGRGRALAQAAVKYGMKLGEGQ